MKLALIGEVLGHSLSPVIHQKCLAALGLSGSYELVEIPRTDLARRVPALLTELDGFNVTIPYKSAVIPFLSSLSPEAARIGAVNTVRPAEAGAAGYNTDYTGFSRTVDRIGADPAGKEAAVLGTGGAARAVIQCLCDRGAARICVASRHPERVDAEFRHFCSQRRAVITSYEGLQRGFLLVNCTPCGMYPKTEASPLPAEKVQDFPKVVDLIYNPKETRLLAAARAGGADTANGMYMLVAQAVAAEEVWLGRAIDPALTEAIAAEMEAL